MAERKNIYTIILEKHERKRPLRRLIQSSHDKVKVDEEVISKGGVVQTHVTQDKDKRRGLMNKVMNMRFP